MTEDIDGDGNSQAAPESDPRAKSPDGTWAFQGGLEQTPVPATDPREDPNPPAPTRNAPARKSRVGEFPYLEVDRCRGLRHRRDHFLIPSFLAQAEMVRF